MLRSLSGIWSAAARLRVAAYRGGFLPTVRLKRPVISVGALGMGGTGKTPAVHALVRVLLEEGLRVAVLSRGYRRTGRGPALVSQGSGLAIDVRRAGDEPTWYALTLPGVMVAVAEKRERAAELVGNVALPDAFVLDDAFQHVRVHRDLDLLVVDGDAPFWESATPPAGRLREHPSAAARADAFLVVGARRASAIAHLRSELPGKPAFELEADAPGCWPLGRYAQTAGDDVPPDFVEPTQLPGPVLAFAGIARPRRFRRALEHAGVDVAAFHERPDHHWHTDRDLAELDEAAGRAGARSLVTTEKDAVRLAGRAPTRHPTFVWRHRLAPRDPETLRAVLVNTVRDAAVS